MKVSLRNLEEIIIVVYLQIQIAVYHKQKLTVVYLNFLIFSVQILLCGQD